VGHADVTAADSAVEFRVGEDMGNGDDPRSAVLDDLFQGFGALTVNTSLQLVGLFRSVVAFDQFGDMRLKF